MTDTPGLTDEDRQKLAHIAEHGVNDFAATGGGGGGTPAEPEGTPITCRYCGYEWRYTGQRARATCYRCGLNTPIDDHDGRGLTPEQCNAIREAARDGLTYREIAALFTFVGDVNPAWRHATGRCQHNGECVPPVESERAPGPPNQVDAAECAALRERYADGEGTVAIADATGRHRATVGRHIHGRCSHD